MLDLLHNIFNVLLIVIGFGLVIFIHELGHFLAARWAGIRVPAFAIGFGNAICSWRRGMGFRTGSSEPAYKARLAEAGQSPETGDLPGVSRTEYRLNWFPFGGYVKMLGQDDLNPNAASASEDSYTSKSPAKRMVVISAGVVMNILLAAILFMIVFSFGMRDTPAVIGVVDPDSPAARAGLSAGDTVVSMDGSSIESFTEVMINTAMAKRGDPLHMVLRRAGSDQTYETDVTPEVGGAINMLQIGVGPALTARIVDPHVKADRELVREWLDAMGLQQVRLGMELVEVNGHDVASVTASGATFGLFASLQDAMAASDGTPVEAVFADDAGQVTALLTPVPELQSAEILDDSGRASEDQAAHLLGFAPLVKVTSVTTRGHDQGLRAGDVLLQVGSARWPDSRATIKAIQARANADIDLQVLRDGAVLNLTAAVNERGQIGFGIGAATGLPVSAMSPRWAEPLPASRLIPAPTAGTRVVAIDGQEINDYAAIRAAALAATPADDGSVTLNVNLMALEPGSLTQGSLASSTWTLTADEVDALRTLTWEPESPLDRVFEQASFVMKARNPVHAVALGVEKTHWIVMQTYLTFVRLFQGSVRVDNLKGPVGIAHIGSQFASEGLIPLLFFLALISANLAVINFLPIPVVDGGQFVMLLVEAITRRPVPIAIQNAATLCGLLLIGAVFLTLTFNDIRNLFVP